MKKWNPQQFIGYSERHGMTGEPATTDALPAIVEEMRAQQQAKLEQERLLGESLEASSPEEIAMIKKKMIERLRGF